MALRQVCQIQNHSKSEENIPTQLPTLPPDILIEIFTTRFPTRAEGYPPDNLPLLAASVCRYWRNVAMTTPSIWSNVIACPTSKYDPYLYFDRSTPRTFDLYVYFDEELPLKTGFMNALRRALSRHYKRLGGLHILYRSRRSTLREFLYALGVLDSLAISKLYIEAMCRAPNSIPDPLWPTLSSYETAHKLPPTPYLVACRIPARWTTLLHYSMPSLTQLHITDCNLSRVHFVGMLERMPTLQVLILQDVAQWRGIAEVDHSLSVELPSLSVLAVHFSWHPPLSSHCHCPLGSIIARNLEVLELGIRFNVEGDEEELLEFHPDSLHEWRKPGSSFQRIIFRGLSDPWHKNNLRIVRLFRKPLHVEYRGFKGDALVAFPIGKNPGPELKMARSFSFDFTRVHVDLDALEGLCRIRQMVELLQPCCPPVIIRFLEKKRYQAWVNDIPQKFEGTLTLNFGLLCEADRWNN